MTAERPVVTPPRFVSSAVEILGRRHVLEEVAAVAPFCRDWTGRFVGPNVVVLRPADTEEVSALVAAARSHGVALIPQGGNTGLVGGAVPVEGSAIVDLGRLDTIDDVDAVGGQVTVGGGVTISALQARARDVGWAYGVDWAARDTATVGGSVATNAGGLRFVRHGGTREQLLGVEAVLGNGTVVRHLPRVDKDNTGVNLGAVLCGSEGTLGMVTKARLRLVSATGPVVVALASFSTMTEATGTAAFLRRATDRLEALELMTEAGVDLVCAALGFTLPVRRGPAYLLVEMSGADATEALADLLASASGVVDVAVAHDSRTTAELWRVREVHTEVISHQGIPHKLDVTLPLSGLGEFCTRVTEAVQATSPEASVWLFGHAADGNVHVNITGVEPDEAGPDEAVIGLVLTMGGSISAEHGIGRAKRRWLRLARHEGDIEAMVELKATFDPDGILNPGVLMA